VFWSFPQVGGLWLEQGSNLEKADQDHPDPKKQKHGLMHRQVKNRAEAGSGQTGQAEQDQAE
jgi:hypothetical protein